MGDEAAPDDEQKLATMRELLVNVFNLMDSDKDGFLVESEGVQVSIEHYSTISLLFTRALKCGRRLSACSTQTRLVSPSESPRPVPRRAGSR